MTLVLMMMATAALSASPENAAEDTAEPAPASTTLTVSAFKMMPFLKDKAVEQPALRSHLDIIVRVIGESREDIRIEIEAPDGDRPLPIDANGVVEWLPLAAALAQNPDLRVAVPTAPDGTRPKFSLNLSLQPRLSLAAEISGEDMRLAVEQANGAIRRQAGLMAAVAPRLKGVAFNIEEGQQAEIIYTDGTFSDPIIADDNGVRIERDRRWKRIDRVRFSAPPTDDAFTR